VTRGKHADGKHTADHAPETVPCDEHGKPAEDDAAAGIEIHKKDGALKLHAVDRGKGSF
jgi:hypothetical protein